MPSAREQEPQEQQPLGDGVDREQLHPPGETKWDAPSGHVEKDTIASKADHPPEAPELAELWFEDQVRRRADFLSYKENRDLREIMANRGMGWRIARERIGLTHDELALFVGHGVSSWELVLLEAGLPPVDGIPDWLTERLDMYLKPDKHSEE